MLSLSSPFPPDGSFKVDATAEIVEGIAEGCKRANCGLIGGETAEMPSMYGDGEYDLGGFSVGAVRRSQLLPRPDEPGMVRARRTHSLTHSLLASLASLLLVLRNRRLVDALIDWLLTYE